MLRKIDDLTADPANPRRLTEAAAAGLSASMLELGDVGGIVWNRRTGHLVAGHARVAHRGCDCNEPDQPPCDQCGERKPVETITGSGRTA